MAWRLVMNIIVINNNVITQESTVQPPILPVAPFPAICTAKSKWIKGEGKCSPPICISEKLLPKGVLVLTHMDPILATLILKPHAVT